MAVGVDKAGNQSFSLTIDALPDKVAESNFSSNKICNLKERI
jgi:hypothetical protein